MKKLIILGITLLAFLMPVKGDEGMWLPFLLKQQKGKDLKKAGMKITADDIYQVNQAAIKDAILGLASPDAGFRSFCTASFISDKGLVITNYHCVLPYIERLSTVDRDFIKYGYWATKPEEETNIYNLQVNQLIRMEDVTQEVTAGFDTLTKEQREKIQFQRVEAIVERATKGNGYKAQVSSFLAGNQLILSVYRFFPDVRMVAAPPMTIGKFGGDTDNWQWPRHTGDFALLRVYANEENKPARYKKENVPYRPAKSLTLSIKGVEEGDFVMALGFPGSTREYIPSFALDKIINKDTKAKADIREAKLKILKEAMAENDTLRMRYTARANSVANTYKKWRGEIDGVRKMDLVNKKRQEEDLFRDWVNGDASRQAKYGSVLADMDSVYNRLTVYNYVDAYFQEAALLGAEVIPFAGKFEKLMAMFRRKNPKESAVKGEARKLGPLTEQFFHNWDYEVDRKIFREMIYRYYANVPKHFHSEAMTEALETFNGDVDAYASWAYENSILTKKEQLLTFLAGVHETGVDKMANDPLYKIAIGFYSNNVDNVIRQKQTLQKVNGELYSLYVQGLMEMGKETTFYPDANGSLRFTYGKVQGVAPQDGVRYEYYTTLAGGVEKHESNPNTPDYYMPKKMRDLQANQDFGVYGTNGTVRANFLTSLHTTSGNSGSPVLNAKGELVGINFDRIWQGVASDYRYDATLARGIAVDIRYVLFIFEKYSRSSYVLDELKIVK